nr:hypothetical protein RVX_2028 [Nitratidesulfovibrio sp. HK-II]
MVSTTADEDRTGERGITGKPSLFFQASIALRPAPVEARRGGRGGPRRARAGWSRPWPCAGRYSGSGSCACRDRGLLGQPAGPTVVLPVLSCPACPSLARPSLAQSGPARCGVFRGCGLPDTRKGGTGKSRSRPAGVMMCWRWPRRWC